MDRLSECEEQHEACRPGVADARREKADARKDAPRPAVKPAKLGYKEQRRLEELNGLIAELPGKIAVLETQLADPGLYGRDPAAFDRFGQALAAARGRLEAAEMEWLELEERREALEARERGDLSADRAKDVMKSALHKAQEAAEGAKERLDFVAQKDFDSLSEAVDKIRDRVTALEERFRGQDGAAGAPPDEATEGREG